MLFYLFANICSALSNTLGKFFVINSYYCSGTRILDVFLHGNLINLFVFFVIFFIKRSRNEATFSLKETFCRKDEIKQILLFAIPVFAASYKLYMMEFMKISDIEISAMIKPFCVWGLAILFLNESFYPFYVKYAIFAILGFLVANKQFLPFEIDWANFNINFSIAKKDGKYMWFLISYLVLASIGDITRRYYCRKWANTMQAVCVEFVMFAIYAVVFLSLRRTFSFYLLFSPYTLILSSITISHHFSIIHGVQKAPTVTALEFINFSKTVFVMIFSFLILHTKIYPNKIIGALIIAITLIMFSLRILQVSSKDKKV